MAIKVNGVSLPDFPVEMRDVLPYACILEVYYTDADGTMEMAKGTYKCFASSSPICFLSKEVNETDSDVIVSVGSYYATATASDGATEWSSIETGEDLYGIDLLEQQGTSVLYNKYKLVWSNHDILMITGVNDDETLVFGDAYFLNSTVTFLKKYSESGEWFLSVAEQVRRLTGKVQRYSTDAILSGLRGLSPVSVFSWIADAKYDGLDARMYSETSRITLPHPFTMEDLVKIADFPNATKMDAGFFDGRERLETANFPVLETVPSNAFADCPNLTDVVISAATSIEDYAFSLCTSLVNIIGPKVLRVEIKAFLKASALTKLDLPVAQWIGANSLAGTAVNALILRATDAVCERASNSFEFTDANMVKFDCPIGKGTGYIYVPAAMVDSYKAHEDWSTYAAQIRAIEDYPDICGT